MRTKDGFKLQTATNQEMIEYSNPYNYQFTYIYESFEWKHCTGTDYSFPSVSWDDQEASYTRMGGWEIGA